MTPYPHKKCPRPPHLGTEYGWGVGLLWDVRGGWRGHQVWQGNPHTVRLSEVAPRVRLPEFLVCQPPDLSHAMGTPQGSNTAKDASPWAITIKAKFQK